MRLGPLLASDLDAALALSSREGWNQRAADWRRLLDLEPEGCSAARDSGRLIGTVTTTTYGRDLERWQGVTSIRAGADEKSTTCELREMEVVDRAAYGVDRKRLLAAIVADGHPAVVDGQGFALARPGRAASYIGPLIAPSGAPAERLLDRLLAQLPGQEVCLDLHVRGMLVPSALAARGLAKRRGLVRMRIGRASGAGTARSICAIAGPEFG